MEHISTAFSIDLDASWKDLSKREQEVILHGNGGKTISLHGYRFEWEGVVHMLMRRFKNTTSEGMRQYYMRFFSDKPCTACKGARLKPESRAVKVGGQSIVQLSAMTVVERPGVPEGTQAHREPEAGRHRTA